MLQKKRPFFGPRPIRKTVSRDQNGGRNTAALSGPFEIRGQQSGPNVGPKMAPQTGTRDSGASLFSSSFFHTKSGRIFECICLNERTTGQLKSVSEATQNAFLQVDRLTPNAAPQKWPRQTRGKPRTPTTSPLSITVALLPGKTEKRTGGILDCLPKRNEHTSRSSEETVHNNQFAKRNNTPNEKTKAGNKTKWETPYREKKQAASKPQRKNGRQGAAKGGLEPQTASSKEHQTDIKVTDVESVAEVRLRTLLTSIWSANQSVAKGNESLRAGCLARVHQD